MRKSRLGVVIVDGKQHGGGEYVEGGVKYRIYICVFLFFFSFVCCVFLWIYVEAVQMRSLEACRLGRSNVRPESGFE